MTKIMRIIMLALCLVFPCSVQAACEKPSHVSELGEAGRIAEHAFAELDAETLLTQSTLARSQILPCVADTLTRQDAAAFHRLMALEAFINGNYTRVRQELHASLLLQPGYLFPTEVASDGHPLLVLYKASEVEPDGNGEKIYPPPGGYVLVGGVRNAARYLQTPVIIQVFTMQDGIETLRETHYIQPQEATPNWSGNAFGITAEDIGINLDDLRQRSPLKDPRAWYIASGASLIAGGVLYALALHEKSLYQDPETSDEDLAGLQRRANSLSTASLICGGATVAFTGLGVGLHVKFGIPTKTLTRSEGVSP